VPWEPTDYFGDGGGTDYFGDGGGTAPKPTAPLGGALDYITQPVKSLFGLTGGVGGKLAGLLLPEAYERARKANLQHNAEAEGEAPNWLEQVETLPGLGDVLVEAAQPTSTWGKALAVPGRIVGNIAGDPTTYLAGAGLLGSIPKAGKGLQAAARAGTAIDRGLGLAAAAYLPETLQGVGEGISQTVEGIKKGDWGGAAAGGASTALLGGLSYLMGKGVITQAKAFRMAQEAGHSPEAVAEALGHGRPGEALPDPPVDLPSGPPGGRPSRPRQAPKETMPAVEPVAEVPPGAIDVTPGSAVGPQEAAGAPSPLPPARTPREAPPGPPEPSTALPSPLGTEPVTPEAPPGDLAAQLQATLEKAQAGERVLAEPGAPGKPRGPREPSPEDTLPPGFKLPSPDSTLPPTPREALGLPAEGQIQPPAGPERTPTDARPTRENAVEKLPDQEPAAPRAGAPSEGAARTEAQGLAPEDWWDSTEGNNIVKQLEARGIEVPADLGLARRLVKGADIPERPARPVAPEEKAFKVTEPGTKIAEAVSPGSLPPEEAARVQAEAAKDYPAYPHKQTPPSQPLSPEQKTVLDTLHTEYEGPVRRITESRTRRLAEAGFHADPAELQSHIDAALNRLALKGEAPSRGEVLTTIKNASNDYARRLRAEKRQILTRAASVEEKAAQGREPRVPSAEDSALADLSDKEVEQQVAEVAAAEKKLPEVLGKLPEQTRKAWEHMRANPDAPLTSVYKELGFNSAQSLGQHLRRADAAVEEALGFNLRAKKAKAASLERPVVPKPATELPAAAEGQGLAEYAAANKEALGEHLPYLASQSGRGGHRDFIVELYNDLGLNPEKLDRGALSSSPKLVGAIMQKLGLEPPPWISSQLKRTMTAEELQALKASRAGAGTVPEGQARRAKLETLKESSTDRAMFTAESEKAKLEIRRTGDEFHIEDAAGPIEAVTDLLGRALKDVSLMEPGYRVRLEKQLFGDLVEALGNSPGLKKAAEGAKFVFFGKKGKPVTMDFLGLQQLSDAVGPILKSGFEYAGKAAVKATELLSRGVTDLGAWTGQMLGEFGSRIKQHLRTLYNAASKALELGEPGSAKRRAQFGMLGDFPAEGAAIEAAVKPKLVVPSAEAFEKVMGQGPEGPTKGAPGGVAKEKGAREKVENINLNTARVELASEQGVREAVALDKLLGRPSKRPWEEVAADVIKQVEKESPDAFVGRISKLSGQLPDTDVTHLRLLTNQALDTMSGVKKTFYDELEKGDAADPAKLADILDSAIHGIGQAEQFLKASKETKAAYARALAIMRMKVSGLDPQLTDRARLREHLGALHVKSDAIPGILDQFSKWQLSGEEKHLDEFLNAVKDNAQHKRIDQALFLWKAFLLTPASQTANLASNVLSLKARGWEQNWIAPALDKAWSAATGRERSIFHVPARVYNKHMQSAFGSAWDRLQEEMGRIVKLKPLAPHYLGGISDLNIRMAAPFTGKKGEFLGTMFKLLEVGDSFAKTLVQQRELLSRAWTLAEKEGTGLKGAALEARAGEIIKDITLAGEFRRAGNAVPEAMQKYLEHVDGIDEAMKRDTFQKGLSGVFHDVGRALQSPGGKYMQAFIPFYKTPVNIALETMARTPVGMGRTLMKLAQGKYKGKERELMEELSRGVLGSILTTGALSMAFAGDITGGGPTDPKRQAMLKETGWQPYSVRVGDNWIAYNRLEPMSSIVGMAADMAESINRGEASKANTLMAKLFSSMAENLTNKTFLSGLEGLFTAWHDPKQYGDRLLKQLQASLIPNTVGPVPFGSLARALDPYFRQTEALTSEPFLAKIPGASGSLKPQLTGLGQPRKRPGSAAERLFSPFQRSETQHTPEAAVASELERVNFVPSPPRDSVKIGGKEIGVGAKELELLRRAREQATSAAYRVISDPSYQALPDNAEDPRSLGGKRKTKEDVLRRVYSRYMDPVKKQVQSQAYRQYLKESR